VTALQWFFVWLTMIAPHYTWLCVIGLPGRPAIVGQTHIYYGGSAIQALLDVLWFQSQGFIAFLSQVIP
jgi:hypothetical protein